LVNRRLLNPLSPASLAQVMSYAVNLGFRLRLHPRLDAVADFVGSHVGPAFREKIWVMTSQ
jgi:hypothetical protein